MRSYVATFIAGAIVVGIPAFFLCAINGNEQIYHNIYIEDSSILSEILSAKQEFSGVKIRERAEGLAQLFGTVPNQETYLELKAIVTDKLGDKYLEPRFRYVHAE